MFLPFQNQRNYLIEELITWKDYEIQMAAYNQIDVGSFSKSITVKTREGGPFSCPQCPLARLHWVKLCWTNLRWIELGLASVLTKPIGLGWVTMG